MNGYNPLNYWQTRGKSYMPNVRASIARVRGELDYLLAFTHEAGVKSILDVGSGWGRTYAALCMYAPDPFPHQAYTMVDFCPSMRENCARVTGKMPDAWDGHTLPYKAGQFDLAILSDVLLHVPADQIDQVFSECVRVSRYLYIASHGTTYGPMAEHCFWHDYMHLASDNKVYPYEVRVFDGGKRVNYIFRKHKR